MDFGERIYELARDALSEQERQVADLRARGPALLAGATVVASLLAKPAFTGSHPDGVLEWVAIASGVGGGLGALVFTVLLFSPRDMAFSFDAQAAYVELFEQGITEQPLVDLTLAESMSKRRADNLPAVDRLRALLRYALASLVVEVGGLALAAALA